MLILLFSLVNFLLIFLVSLRIILSLVCKLMIMMMIIFIIVSRAIRLMIIMMMDEAARLLLVAVSMLNLGLNLWVDFLSVLCLKMMGVAVFILIEGFSGLLLDLEFLFGKSHRIALMFFHFIVEFL